MPPPRSSPPSLATGCAGLARFSGQRPAPVYPRLDQRGPGASHDLRTIVAGGGPCPAATVNGVVMDMRCGPRPPAAPLGQPGLRAGDARDRLRTRFQVPPGRWWQGRSAALEARTAGAHRRRRDTGCPHQELPARGGGDPIRIAPTRPLAWPDDRRRGAAGAGPGSSRGRLPLPGVLRDAGPCALQAAGDGGLWLDGLGADFFGPAQPLLLAAPTGVRARQPRELRPGRRGWMRFPVAGALPGLPTSVTSRPRAPSSPTTARPPPAWTWATRSRVVVAGRRRARGLPALVRRAVGDGPVPPRPSPTAALPPPAPSGCYRTGRCGNLTCAPESEPNAFPGGPARFAAALLATGVLRPSACLPARWPSNPAADATAYPASRRAG